MLVATAETKTLASLMVRIWSKALYLQMSHENDEGKHYIGLTGGKKLFFQA